MRMKWFSFSFFFDVIILKFCKRHAIFKYRFLSYFIWMLDSAKHIQHSLLRKFIVFAMNFFISWYCVQFIIVKIPIYCMKIFWIYILYLFKRIVLSFDWLTVISVLIVHRLEHRICLLSRFKMDITQVTGLWGYRYTRSDICLKLSKDKT